MTISQADIDERTVPLSSTGEATSIRVLLVGDDDEFASLVADYLRAEHDFTVLVETGPEAALDTLEEDDVDCVVSDYAMSPMDGLEFLEAVKRRDPDQPFVLFASQGSEAVASQAIQRGADDYLRKDTGETCSELLATRIENCVIIARQQRELQDIHTAIEQAGHAMLVTDADGTITYANRRMEDVSGYSCEELRGSTPSLLKSGEHDPAFYQDIWDTILDGDVWEGEVVNEHKEGHQYIIDQTIAPIQNNGEITNFVAINRDITAEKRRERDLTFFEEAIEQLGVGVTAYDSTGTIRYTNEAYAALLGSTTRDLQGEHITVVNPEFDRENFESYWESFDLNETRRRETVHQRLDDDATVPVETVTTYTEIDGHRYHIGTIQDITDRKERERELQKFRKAVEEAGHSILVTDTDGTIEYANPAFEEVTGYTREEAIGRSPAILSSGAHDDEFYRDLWTTILDGETWRGEIVNERKNGEPLVIDQTISPLTDEDGTITHFVAINRDVTELKERRRQLERQNERLERFGHTVAHDLRNPLGVLDGYLDMARSEGIPSDVCEEMQTSIDRMTELIEELLALAEQGKTVLDPEPVSIEAVTEAAWKHVDTREMTLDIDVDGDATLSMDESRVVQLFENLVRNARDHAGEDAHIRVGPLEDGFYVEDDGPGIPEANHDTVLESGFTTSEDGTGFGLAIVNQIADAHGWRVEIADGARGGARFEFHDVSEGIADD